MDYLTLALAFVAKWTLALGVLGTASYQLFKHLGAKWLDEHFKRKSDKLKEDHDKVMADIKAAQEMNVMQVRSFVDREMHRAKKLYDKEFDMLSQAWATLDTLYGYVIESTHDVGLHDWDEAEQEDIRIILSETSFTPLQKRYIAAAPTPDQATLFRETYDWNRKEMYLKSSNDFAEYLRAQGIFMPKDIRAKFNLLNALIHRVFVRFELKVQGRDSSDDEMRRLFSDENKAVRTELGDLIHTRFWSADGTAIPASDAHLT